MGWWIPGGCQGRAWQPGLIPPPQPGAEQPGNPGAAPSLGIGHLPGDRDGPRPGRAGPSACRAGESWRPTPLRCCWELGLKALGRQNGVLGPGQVGGGSREARKGQLVLLVPSGTSQLRRPLPLVSNYLSLHLPGPSHQILLLFNFFFLFSAALVLLPSQLHPVSSPCTSFPTFLAPFFFIFIQSSCPCLWFLHSPLPPQVPTNDARENPHRIWEIELGALTIYAHVLWWSSVFFDPLNIFHWLYRRTWLTTLILLSKSWLFSIQSSLTNYSRHSQSSVSFSGEAWLSQAMFTLASSRDQTEMELRIEVFNTYTVCASLFQTRSNLGSEESPGRVGNLSSKEAQTIPFIHCNGSCHIQTLLSSL